MCAAVAEKIVDVRTVVPAQRHPMIFGAFEDLEPGGAFVLVNDHDPKPLFYQFQAERTGQVAWKPQEQGPERWVIRIEKVALNVPLDAARFSKPD